MGLCNIRPSAVLVLFVLAAATAQHDISGEPKQVDFSDNVIGEAVTIKLKPLENRKKGDLRALVERLKSLPELRSASIIIASLDLLVLVPTHEQTLEQMKAALLQQPEVYELEVNEQTYRRERDADKPYEQLRRERLAQALSNTKTKIQDRLREKLRQLMQGKEKKLQQQQGKDKLASDDAATAPAGTTEDRGSLEGRMSEDTQATKQAVLRATKRQARKAKRRAAKWKKRNEGEAAEL